MRQIFAQVAAAPEAEGGVALAPPPGDFGGGAGSPGGGENLVRRALLGKLDFPPAACGPKPPRDRQEHNTFTSTPSL